MHMIFRLNHLTFLFLKKKKKLEKKISADYKSISAIHTLSCTRGTWNSGAHGMFNAVKHSHVKSSKPFK